MSDYTPEIYEDANGFQPFGQFFKSLPEVKQLLLEQTISGPLSVLGIEICQEKSHGRQLGKGVFEVKTEATESEVIQFFVERDLPLPQGVGGDVMLRTFCHAYGEKRILLLHGYDKGLQPKARQQNKEIQKARKHLTAWQEANKRQRAADRKRPPAAQELAVRARAALARTFSAWIAAFKKARRRPKT